MADRSTKKMSKKREKGGKKVDSSVYKDDVGASSKSMKVRNRRSKQDQRGRSPNKEKPVSRKAGTKTKQETQSREDSRERVSPHVRAASSPVPAPASTAAPDPGRRPEYAMRNPDLPSQIQLGDLRHYVKEVMEKGVQGLLDEFETVKNYKVEPVANKAHLENPTKNRYKDIYCIDPTRVVLDGFGNNYIHANHVRGEPFINDFICTQGPLETTTYDFWKMVAQENVGYIVMLCDLVELGKKKCEKYIPERVDEERTFGEVKVRMLECNSVDPNFVISHLLLEAPGVNRVIFHYQWKEWPDHGVPVTTNAALRALSGPRGSTFTAIVHCSAGVGRTGTLVAVEWVLQTIMKGERVDMKKMVIELRNQRAHAIQTNMQYVYVAQCALRLWTKVDKEKLDPFLSNEDLFLKFTADMKIANPAAYNPK